MSQSRIISNSPKLILLTEPEESKIYSLKLNG
jgi:hypothetical protein